MLQSEALYLHIFQSHCVTTHWCFPRNSLVAVLVTPTYLPVWHVIQILCFCKSACSTSISNCSGTNVTRYWLGFFLIKRKTELRNSVEPCNSNLLNLRNEMCNSQGWCSQSWAACVVFRLRTEAAPGMHNNCVRILRTAVLEFHTFLWLGIDFNSHLLA